MSVCKIFLLSLLLCAVGSVKSDSGSRASADGSLCVRQMTGRLDCWRVGLVSLPVEMFGEDILDMDISQNNFTVSFITRENL